MIRVAICQFGEETNTFVTKKVQMQDLCPNGWVPGEQVTSYFSGTQTYICGALQALADQGAAAVPMDIPAANGCNFIASGILSGDCLRTVVRRICAELKCRRVEYDCVFFAMHGAACAEIDEDVESYVLREIRKEIGDVKIMSSLDLHGNITEEMVRLSDGYIGLKTVPHTDCFEAGYRAAEMLCRTMRGEIHPRMALRRLPILISSSAGSTLSGVAKEIKEYFAQYAKKQNLLDVSFFHGFSSTDRKCSCASVLVTADGYVPNQEADVLAQYIWAHRDGFLAPSLSAEEAVDLALKKVRDGYVVINESSDNPGSGCPGDATHLLREFLKRDLPRCIMGPLFDPEAAAICHQHEIGDHFPLEVGGHTEPIAGEPLVFADVELLALSDGAFISASPVNQGVAMNFGASARLRAGNVEFILVSQRFQTFDDRPFLMTGCNMKDYSIVGLKSMNHFRGYFAPIADGIVTADTPGLRPANLKMIDYRHVNRPIFPLDADVEYKTMG